MIYLRMKISLKLLLFLFVPYFVPCRPKHGPTSRAVPCRPSCLEMRPDTARRSCRACPAHLTSCRAVLWAVFFVPCLGWPEKPGPNSQL